MAGESHAEPLSPLSLNVEGLHHDFASTLLDHLFGIQNRAGCACAGPYGHRLLHVDREESDAFRGWIRRGVLGIKPGWVRVTLSPYASAADVEFILAAIELVADHGEDFLSAYELDWRDGVWRARDWEEPPPPVALSLDDLLAAPASAAPSVINEEQLAAERASYFGAAQAAAASLRARHGVLPANPSTGDPELDRRIWFRFVHATGAPAACTAVACRRGASV